MSVGKLITKNCDNMPVESHVAFNSDGSIVIWTCAEDAQRFVPERTCEGCKNDSFKEYTVVSMDLLVIYHLWYGDSLDQARRILAAYEADGIYDRLAILQHDVTAWEQVEE